MKVLGLSVLLLWMTASFSTADDAPLVMTLDGEISGVTEESTKGKTFYSYHSIPFAEPPLGDLRFKNPEKGRSWDDVRDGSKWPPRCYQVMYFGLQPGEPQQSGSEDCLYLNIFTTKPNEELARLPVMIFIHGGAFVMGGTEEYPPHVLMNHDIILVTIQYRLGMLGFLSTEDTEAPGNLGLKDQTMAINWIQQNIHMFGGDGLEMTIFGESAGAASVHYQILSPRAIGLFKRAILQSGSALCPWATGGAFLEVAEYIAQTFNCTTDEGSKQMITCLQKLPVEELVPIQIHFNVWHMNPFIFGPRVDGDFIPMEPEDLMKEARHKRIDIISGITSHEGGLITMPMYANERLRAAMMLNFREIGPTSLEFSEGDISPLNQTLKIFDHYVGGFNIDEKSADNLTQMYSDRYFTICHDLTSSLHAKNTKRKNKNVFRYELTHRGQRSLNDAFDLTIGKHYVSHADDLFYLFSGGPYFQPLENEEDLKLRDIMTTLWTNFAIHGNPTPELTLGFKWDPVTSGDLCYLDLKPEPKMKDDNRAQVREFWAALPLKQNLILHPDRVANLTITTVEETTEGKPSEDKEERQETTEKEENVDSKIQESENEKIKKDEL